MKLFYTERFRQGYESASLDIQRQFDRRVALLVQNLRHPSLRAKKYDKARAIWQARVYFASGSDARKVLNLKANSRVAVTVDLYADDWANLKGVMIQGTAKLIEKGPRFRTVRALLYKKYPQYPNEAALEESDSVIVEVTPTRVFSWGVE